MNINSSSSADRRENSFRILPTKVIFHFKISWLASYFVVQGNPEKKRKKTFTCQWSNSKEKESLKKMESKLRKVEVIWELKTGRLRTDQIQKVIHI